MYRAKRKQPVKQWRPRASSSRRRFFGGFATRPRQGRPGSRRRTRRNYGCQTHERANSTLSPTAADQSFGTGRDWTQKLLKSSFTATCRVDGKTGVEMEALTAVSIAALTLYDMLKAYGKGMVIQETRLLSKIGGKSGSWQSEARA